MTPFAGVIYTVAPMRTGKSYLRCARFLCDELLPETDMVSCSNYPIGVIPATHKPTPPAFEGETYLDRIIERVVEKTKREAAEFEHRVKMIPQSVLDDWRDMRSGPWDYFKDMNIDGWYISIDEIHNYCNRRSPRAWREKWSKFLGEIGHRQARLEVLTQSPEKVAAEIEIEAEVRFDLVNQAARRDPLFRILYGDLYELRAKFLTFEYFNAVALVESKKFRGKWIEQDRRIFYLDPIYFDFYNSYSKPVQGGAGASAHEREYEKHGPIGLLWWFWRRNWWRLSSRFAAIGVLLWVFCGGGGLVVRHVLDKMNAAMSKNVKNVAAAPEPETRTGVSVPAVVSVPGGRAGLAGTAAGIAAGVPVSKDWPAEALETVKRLEKQRDDLREERAELAELVEDLTTLRMISGPYVGLGYGVYLVGEVINAGPFKGDRIMQVRPERREVVLSSGRVLVLGVSPANVARVAGAEVRPVVQGGGRGQGGAAGGGGH